MSLFNSLRTSISGMNAQTTRLDTISDNIANASTVGYKRAAAHFTTVMTDVQSKTYTSGGVAATTRYNVNEQGILQATQSATDLAIQGNGLFYVENSNQSPALTRAGSFVTDANGDLKNAAGYFLMGYPLNGSSSGAGATTNINDLTRINLSNHQLIASPTTEGSFVANLPSTADVSTGALPSTNVAGAEFTAKSSLVAYGNLGEKVLLDVFFTKTAANTWEMTVFNAADASPGGFPYSSASLTSLTLNFDPTNGSVVGSPTASIAIPGGQSLTLDLNEMTQLAVGYQIQKSQLNGSGPSTIDRVEISPDGKLSVLYQDGTRRNIFQVPLATVASPNNLQALSSNTYAESSESGAIILGNPGTSTLGSIVSSYLESASVDLGDELTSMIETQRSYTANSKVFKTSSEMLEILMSVRN